MRFAALPLTALPFASLSLIGLSAVALLFACCPAASAIGHHPPDAQSLASLEARAASAPPRDQPWLYARLVHSMTHVAAAEYHAGHIREASAALQRARLCAQRIPLTLLRNAHKLQSAEILVRHTAFQLRQLLMGGIHDRAVVEATIQRLNEVQAEMLTQEFQP
jgi:hypothetical protein